MTDLFAFLLAFPTVAYAVLAVLCMLYWGLVLVGVADMDALDGAGGAVDGAADAAVDGAVEAVTGGAKGVAGAVGELLSLFGLTRVPVTISASMFSLFGLFFSVTSRTLLDPVLPGFVSAIVALVVSLPLSMGLTSLLVRPLGRIFDEGKAPEGGATLLGQTCRITITADTNGGQGIIDDRIIVPVRYVGGSLPRGEEAVLMERAEDGVFLVEPLRTIMPDSNDAFARLQAEDAARTESASVSESESESESEAVPVPVPTETKT
jgi:hypothetical protein